MSDPAEKPANPMIPVAIGLVAIGAAVWAVIKMFGAAISDFVSDLTFSAAQYTATKTGVIAIGIGIGIAMLAILGLIALGIRAFTAGQTPPPPAAHH